MTDPPDVRGRRDVPDGELQLMGYFEAYTGQAGCNYPFRWNTASDLLPPTHTLVVPIPSTMFIPGILLPLVPIDEWTNRLVVEMCQADEAGSP